MDRYDAVLALIPVLVVAGYGAEVATSTIQPTVMGASLTTLPLPFVGFAAALGLIGHEVVGAPPTERNS